MVRYPAQILMARAVMVGVALSATGGKAGRSSGHGSGPGCFWLGSMGMCPPRSRWSCQLQPPRNALLIRAAPDNCRWHWWQSVLCPPTPCCAPSLCWTTYTTCLPSSRWWHRTSRNSLRTYILCCDVLYGIPWPAWDATHMTLTEPPG